MISRQSDVQMTQQHAAYDRKPNSCLPLLHALQGQWKQSRSFQVGNWYLRIANGDSPHKDHSEVPQAGHTNESLE